MKKNWILLLCVVMTTVVVGETSCEGGDAEIAVLMESPECSGGSFNVGSSKLNSSQWRSDGGAKFQTSVQADINTSPVIQMEAAIGAYVSLMKKVDLIDKEDDMPLSHKRNKPLVDNGNMCFHFEMHDNDKGKCMILHAVDILLRPPLLSLVNTDFKVLDSSAHISPISRYIIKKRLVKGGFGEAWLSCTQEEHSLDLIHDKKETLRRRFCLDTQSIHSKSPLFNHECHSSSDIGDYFVIKRIMVEKGHTVYLSGLREKYFGEVLLNASLHNKKGNKHVARYVKSLDCGEQGIWLVFRHEGISFSKILYTTVIEDPSTGGHQNVNTVKILEPSSYWKWLKTTAEEREEMKQIILQLLMAIKFCHDLDITHRDIKPDNMILCFEDHANHKCLKQRSRDNQQANMRIIDFGSAIDEFTIKHLYGSSGPSRYDMWSVGVVMLEIIIGSPHVFQLSHRAYALLALRFKNLNEDEMKLLYQIRSLMELCIIIPEDIDLVRNWKADNLGNFPTSSKCSEEVFANQIKSRDPLKIGFSNLWALRLVRQFLQWNPEERLSAADTLRHPYFRLPTE